MVSKVCAEDRCDKHALPNGRCRSHYKVEWARQQRKTDPQKYKDKSFNYEKTQQGFLMRAYRNMKSRVTGVQKKKAYLYIGKELLPKDDFYLWSKSNPDFLRLFKEWVSANHDQRLSPSVNRVDSNKGYTLDNMEWITHSQNSGLSSVTKKLKDKERKQIYNILGVGKNEKT